MPLVSTSDAFRRSSGTKQLSRAKSVMSSPPTLFNRKEGNDMRRLLRSRSIRRGMPVAVLVSFASLIGCADTERKVATGEPSGSSGTFSANTVQPAALEEAPKPRDLDAATGVPAVQLAGRSTPFAVPTRFDVDSRGGVTFEIPPVPGLSSLRVTLAGDEIKPTTKSASSYQVNATSETQTVVVSESFDDGTAVAFPITVFPEGAPSVVRVGRSSGSPGTVVASVAFGAGDNEVGRDGGQQGSTTVPAAIAAGPRGQIYVLDAAKSRVLGATSAGEAFTEVMKLPTAAFATLLVDDVSGDVFAVESGTATAIAVADGGIVRLPELLRVLPAATKMSLTAGQFSLVSPIDGVEYVLGQIAGNRFVSGETVLRRRGAPTIFVRGDTITTATESGRSVAKIDDATTIDVLDYSLTKHGLTLLIGVITRDAVRHELITIGPDSQASSLVVDYNAAGDVAKPLAVGNESVFIMSGNRSGISIQEIRP